MVRLRDNQCSVTGRDIGLGGRLKKKSKYEVGRRVLTIPETQKVFRMRLGKNASISGQL
jgi:hypothetical protein